DRDTRAVPVRVGGMEGVGTVSHRQHDVVDVVGGEVRDHALDHGDVGHRQQLLRCLVREWPQPRALASDEDHGPHGEDVGGGAGATVVGVAPGALVGVAPGALVGGVPAAVVGGVCPGTVVVGRFSGILPASGKVAFDAGCLRLAPPSVT